MLKLLREWGKWRLSVRKHPLFNYCGLSTFRKKRGFDEYTASTLSTKEELFIKRRCVVARAPRPDRQSNGSCLTNFGPPSCFRGDHPLVAL